MAEATASTEATQRRFVSNGCVGAVRKQVVYHDAKEY